MRDGIKNQKKNPEVPVDLSRSISLLNEQVFALKALTNLLKNAYQGLDVEWDMEEVFHGGESSGVGPIASSGDGSGDEDSDAGGSSATVPQGGAPQTPSTPTATTPTQTLSSTQRTAEDDIGGGNGGEDVDDTEDADDSSDDDDAAGTESGGSKPTLQKALAAYLLPVVAVWFGGSFLEWILW